MNLGRAALGTPVAVRQRTGVNSGTPAAKRVGVWFRNWAVNGAPFRPVIPIVWERAKPRKPPRRPNTHADVSDQRMLDSSFTAVTALNVFHLLDDIPSVLTRLQDLLAPGGLLISQTPCLGERKWLVRSLIGLAQKIGLAPPIQSLTVTALESLVSESGFELLESEIWDEKDAIQRIVATKPGGVSQRSTG